MTSPTCVDVRETLSAEFDGEVASLDTTVVAHHLDVCGTCRSFAATLPELARRTRVGEAARVPDLTASIMTSLAEDPPSPQRRRARDLRLLVGLAGVAQLVLALPMLLGLIGPNLHLGRDLGALQVALGVGLVFAALQPRRAAGLLPVVTVVAATTVIAAIVDVATGVASVTAELTHLAELVGVMALWGLTRIDARARSEPSPTTGPDLRMEPV